MRRQLYIDVSSLPAGGGSKPDGSITPYFDLDVMVKILEKKDMNLVLDPQTILSHWGIQCALRDAFGWDGKDSFREQHIDRLRNIVNKMIYIPPMRVHNIVVVGQHDRCTMSHPGDD